MSVLTKQFETYYARGQELRYKRRHPGEFALTEADIAQQILIEQWLVMSQSQRERRREVVRNRLYREGV